MKKLSILLGAFLIIFLGFTYLSVTTADQEISTCELVRFEDMERINFRKHDSILVAASTLYDGNLIKEFMQGAHYRDAWSTPIRVPVLFLDTMMGGMTILEEGGGNQTTSLDVKSPNGVVYSLRSVNKNPEKFIPDFLRLLGLENIVIDGTSAQHPYGALLAAALAEPLGISHTRPKLVFLPRQATLDTLNDKYGNRLYLLEYETEGEKNWTRHANVTELIDTEDLIELRMENKNKISIDEQALVRARLFDILIGDWDRHSNQWGWALQHSPNGIKAIPIAGDRDNAFYNIGGVIPGIVSNEHITSELRPFKEEIDFLPGLVKPFDSYFLYHTPDSVFIKEAQYIQEVLDDQTIQHAMDAWPQEIYDLDGEEIASKLKSRRDDLAEYAQRFKEILIEKGLPAPRISGSDDIPYYSLVEKCFTCF